MNEDTPTFRSAGGARRWQRPRPVRRRGCHAAGRDRPPERRADARPFGLGPVPAGRLDRQGRDDHAAHGFDLELGDHFRQGDPAARSAFQGRASSKRPSGPAVRSRSCSTASPTGPTDPMASIFVAAMREWRRSAAKGLLTTESLKESLQDRIERVMNITLGREMDQLERYMGFLASVGSAAPFVGLFGTVWGIMNSFAAIAARRTPASRSWRRALRKPCSRRRWVWSPPFRRCWPITSSPAISAATATGSRPSSGEFGAILSRQLEEKH